MSKDGKLQWESFDIRTIFVAFIIKELRQFFLRHIKQQYLISVLNPSHFQTNYSQLRKIKTKSCYLNTTWVWNCEGCDWNVQIKNWCDYFPKVSSDQSRLSYNYWNTVYVRTAVEWIYLYWMRLREVFILKLCFYMND